MNWRDAGVASVFPAASVALTENLCEPSPSFAVVFGELHGEKAPESILHLNVEPGSLDEKRKVGVGSLIWAPLAGPAVIVVFGSAVSSEKSRVAVLELPAWSVALTRKV